MTTSRRSVKSAGQRREAADELGQDDEGRGRKDAMEREDGDGAVDEGQPPVEGSDRVDSGGTPPDANCLTPRSVPPDTPPPTRSSSSPSGSTVELRVQTKRCGSGTGSRPSSSKRQPPSAAHEPQPTTAAAVADPEHRDDPAARTNEGVPTAAGPPQGTPPEDVIGDKPPTNTSPPEDSTIDRRVETKRRGSSSSRGSARGGSRPTSSKRRSPSTGEKPAVIGEPAEEVQQGNVADSSAVTSTDTSVPSADVQVPEEASVDRVSLKAGDNEENHTATSDSTSNVDATTADDAAEPREQVQPEVASEKPVTAETNPDNKPEVTDAQEAPEQRPEGEIPSSKVEPEAVNGADQPETEVADNRAAETVAADQPEATPMTEAEVAAMVEDDTAELANSLESSSMVAIRRLHDRVPTPGPRRIVSANEPGVSGSPRTLQTAEMSVEEHAEERENEVGALPSQRMRKKKLRPDMKRFSLFVRRFVG